jgi:predicted Fe-Mo cluster-binding NifX family protein
MKMAVSTWNGRISPVFDVSRHMVVVEIDQGIIHRKLEESLDKDLGRKVEKITGDGIQLLICGAISQSLAEMLTLRGVQVIPFIAGNVDEVIQASMAGQLNQSCFVMPGCCGRRRHRFRTKRCGDTEH